MSQFKEILVFGDSRFLGDVYAKKFIGVFEGDINGNADTAIKARQDILGNPISTYIRSAEADAQQIVFTRGDGSTFSVTTQDIQTEVIDNLESTSTTAALSANMGRVLEEEVSELRTAATWSIY